MTSHWRTWASKGSLGMTCPAGASSRQDPQLSPLSVFPPACPASSQRLPLSHAGAMHYQAGRPRQSAPVADLTVPGRVPRSNKEGVPSRTPKSTSPGVLLRTSSLPSRLPSGFIYADEEDTARSPNTGPMSPPARGSPSPPGFVHLSAPITPPPALRVGVPAHRADVGLPDDGDTPTVPDHARGAPPETRAGDDAIHPTVSSLSVPELEAALGDLSLRRRAEEALEAHRPGMLSPSAAPPLSRGDAGAPAAAAAASLAGSPRVPLRPSLSRGSSGTRSPATKGRSGAGTPAPTPRTSHPGASDASPRVAPTGAPIHRAESAPAVAARAGRRSTDAAAACPSPGDPRMGTASRSPRSPRSPLGRGSLDGPGALRGAGGRRDGAWGWESSSGVSGSASPRARAPQPEWSKRAGEGEGESAAKSSASVSGQRRGKGSYMAAEDAAVRVMDVVSHRQVAPRHRDWEGDLETRAWVELRRIESGGEGRQGAGGAYWLEEVGRGDMDALAMEREGEGGHVEGLAPLEEENGVGGGEGAVDRAAGGGKGVGDPGQAAQGEAGKTLRGLGRHTPG